MSIKNNDFVRYSILLIITFYFLVIFLPSPSFACSCVPSGPVKDELKNSVAVFSGKVVKIVDKNKDKSIQSSDDPIAVIFEVNESWKGVDQSQVVVYTSRDSASCGFEFMLNNDYLVYAQEIDEELHVSLCSRTTLLSAAHQDIKELGEGEEPTKQVQFDLSSENSSNSLPLYIAFFFGGSVLVALLLKLFLIKK